MPLAEVRAAAENCLDEISADLSPNWIRFYSAIVGWILRTLFDGVTMNRTDSPPSSAWRCGGRSSIFRRTRAMSTT